MCFFVPKTLKCYFGWDLHTALAHQTESIWMQECRDLENVQSQLNYLDKFTYWIFTDLWGPPQGMDGWGMCGVPHTCTCMHIQTAPPMVECMVWPHHYRLILFEDLWFVETPPPMGGWLGVWVF